MKQLKSYIAYLAEDGALAIITPFLSSNEPSTPEVYYDGGKHVLFKKNKEEEFIFDYLNNLACIALKKNDEILVVEADVEKDIVYRQYPVKVNLLSDSLNLPLEVSAET